MSRCNNDLREATEADLERGRALWLEMRGLAEDKKVKDKKGQGLLGTKADREVYTALHDFFIRIPTTFEAVAEVMASGGVGGLGGGIGENFRVLFFYRFLILVPSHDHLQLLSLLPGLLGPPQRPGVLPAASSGGVGGPGGGIGEKSSSAKKSKMNQPFSWVWSSVNTRVACISFFLSTRNRRAL